MLPSQYFRELNLGALNEMTQTYIREKVLTSNNIDMMAGTKEYSYIQDFIKNNFPEALGLQPKVEPEKIQKSDSKKEKREKLQAAALLKKQEAQKIKQDKLRAKQDEKVAHKESVEAIKKQITELTELSELLAETEGQESKEALELIQETLPDLKKSLKVANKKKFLNGGDVDAKYDVKIWKSKEDFDKGESENFSTKVDLTNAITDAKTSMSMGSYAVEIYDSESGETYFDSTEDSIETLQIEETDELEGKYCYKWHEERGNLTAHVENMSTNDIVWEFSYPDFTLDEDDREAQSTLVEDGFMKNWDDTEGLEAYLKDLTLLPDDAELLSEDEAIQKHNYKEGGSIINQYEGKTDEQVWDEWSSDQRAHFMSDHNLDEFYTAHQVKYKFIDDRIKEQLKLHLLEGEYKTGGAIKNKERVETVLKHYLMAALWSSTDSENDDTPFDSDYDTDDFDADNVKKIRAHITKFLMDNEADLKKSGLDDEQIGHDLWLTQVGHGAGFWGRDGVSKELGEKLSKASEKLGRSANVYAQDGKVAIDGMSNVDEMAKGGHVSKGELVWGKLSSSERSTFLYENFTPEITPRSQETLVGKAYNFLPKNVKIKFEAKYANVEEYAKGGEVEEQLEFYNKIVAKLKKSGIKSDAKYFDQYQGVYINTPKGKIWTTESFSRGEKVKSKAKYSSAYLSGLEGQTSADKGDYFQLEPDYVFEGETLVLTLMNGEEKRIKEPKVSDLPSFGEVERTFTYTKGTEKTILVLSPEKNPDEAIEVSIDAKGNVDAADLIDYLKDKKASGGAVGKTVFTKDGVEVEKATDKYKGHIFFDEDGGKYECLGYFPKLDDCKYLNLQTKKEVVGCMDGFYFNNPLETKKQGGDVKHHMDKLSNEEQVEYDSLMHELKNDKYFAGNPRKRLEELQKKQGLWRGYSHGGDVATEIKKGTQILFTYEGKQHKGEVEEVREKGDYIVGYLDMVGQVLVKPEDIIEVTSYAKGGGVGVNKFEFPIFVDYDAKKYAAVWKIKAKNENAAKDIFVEKRGQNLNFNELFIVDTSKKEWAYKKINKSPFNDNDDFLDALETSVDKAIDEGHLKGHKYADGGGVGNTQKDFDNIRDLILDRIVENSIEVVGEVPFTEMEKIAHKESSKENFEKFCSLSEKISNKWIKEPMVEMCQAIKDGRFKNLFRFTYGGKAGDISKVSQVSDLFDIYIQAYHYENYKKGGAVGGEKYIVWSSWFDKNKYDIDKIKKSLQSIGAANIHSENQYGWSNQPEVVVFTGDSESAQKAVSEAFGTEWIIVKDKDWKKGKYAMGGEITTIDDSNISDKLRKKAEAKIKKKDTVVEFGYSDYGGGFYDKVAIKYFAENHPKNIVYAKSGYNGEQALVFGKVADKYLAERGDGGLGFGDMEDMYVQMENRQEEKEFNSFLNGLKKDYTVKKDTLTNLKEEKSGSYQMQPNELDFNSEELTQYLLDEGYIEKKGADGKKVESRVDRKKLKQGGGVDNEKFEVATFDSFDDSNAAVVEGGLSFEKAEKMANELWSSGKYYGVEIISSDPDNLEPIVWIRSKNSTKGDDDKQNDYLSKIEKETQAQKKKAESKGAKGYLNVINEILNYDNGSYLTEIKKFIPLKEGKMAWASIKTYKGYEIKFNKNGVDYFGVFDGDKILSVKNTSIEDAKERIDSYSTKKPKRVNRKKKK